MPLKNSNVNFSTLRRNYTHPHELYTQLQTLDRVYFDPSIRCWLVTGYSAVTTILNDPRFHSKLDANTMSNMPSVSRQLLFMDGELHHKAQEVLLRQLSRMVKKMSEDIRHIVEDVLATVQLVGEMDVVKEFAAPISLFTIAHILGIPIEDREQLWLLEHWSDTFSDITSGYFNGDRQDVQRLEEYFRHLIAAKRSSRKMIFCAHFFKQRIFFKQKKI